MSGGDSYSTYYPTRGFYGERRTSPPMSGYRPSTPPPSSSLSRMEKSNSLEDLRKQYEMIANDVGPAKTNAILKNDEDMSWERQGQRIQDFLEKKANDDDGDGYRGEHRPRYFQRRRYGRPEDRPLIINGTVIPQKDAQLIQLVLNNKTTLKAQLDIAKQPIVGVEHIVEYIDPQGESPRVYYCNSCNQFNSCSTIMEHITGFNHRVRYIGQKFPNQAKMYLMPDGRRANRIAPLMKMAAMRCQELELVYGRGDFVTKTETPVIPENALDADETDIVIAEGQQTDMLKKCLKDIKKCVLETPEDIRIAKQIINDLTDAIIMYKQSTSEGISALIQHGRAQVEHSRIND